MTNGLTLKGKMLLPLVLGVAIVSVGLILFLTYFFNKTGEEQLMQSAKSLIIAAEGAKENTTHQRELGVFKDPVNDSLSREQFMSQVPIVVSMNIAKDKAKEIGAEVRIPSDNYRNEENAPTEAEQKVLDRLRASGESEIVEMDSEAGLLRYYKAIRLEEECLVCHGNPNNPEHNIWGSTDGTDLTGNKMEDMKVGDLKGAYEVMMPLALADAVVDDNLAMIIMSGLLPIIIMVLVGIIIFKTNLKTIKKTSDKIGLMKEGFEEGDLSTRVNPEEVDPVFKDLMISTNSMVESVIVPLNTTNEYINTIASGEIPPKNTEEVKGEFNKTKNSINSLIDTLSGFVTEIKRVSDAHDQGWIKEELDSDRFQGVYKEMSLLVNELVLQHINTKKAVMNTALKYGEGDFDAKLPPQPNDKKFLNDGLDTIQNNLHAFAGEINSIIENVTSGNTKFRGNPENYTGDWAKLVDGLNGIVDSLMQPMDTTLHYLDNIAKGDISHRVTEEFKGDFNQTKEALNQVIDTLNALHHEVTYVFDQHEQGWINVEMDPEKFEGSYSELCKSVNALVIQHINMKKRVMSIVTDYAHGDFESTLPPQPNDRKFLNEGLNAVQSNLYGISDEINAQIEAAKAGNLDRRGDSSKFSGDWSKLVASVNELMESIAEPINESGVILQEYSNGNLKERMHGDYKGSFADLKSNINALGESLTELITQVKDSVKVASSTAGKLSDTSVAIKEAAYEQSAQTDDVASAVEEMSRTISENAVSAGQTAEIATKNKEIASEGGEIVRKTLQKMHDIANIVTSSSEEIQKLGHSSEKIGQIISVIEDIADQTNLLALNAAIEAARAGEQGRGFAVVADEVRKLAERTTDATKQISSMIQGIQEETELAVKSMNRGNEEVGTGINLADSAGEALTQIERSSADVLDMINQIAAANDEQSSTSEEISKNVLTISEVIGNSARQVEDIATSASNLNSLTASLESLMAQFIIDEIHGGDQSNGNLRLSSLRSGKQQQLGNGKKNGTHHSNGNGLSEKLAESYPN